MEREARRVEKLQAPVLCLRVYNPAMRSANAWLPLTAEREPGK
jgi:hypothetical protein